MNPDEPPPAPPGSTRESPDPPYWSGTIVTYTCNDGLMSPNGTTSFTIISTYFGWTALDPNFGCFNGDYTVFSFTGKLCLLMFLKIWWYFNSNLCSLALLAFYRVSYIYLDLHIIIENDRYR